MDNVGKHFLAFAVQHVWPHLVYPCTHVNTHSRQDTPLTGKWQVESDSLKGLLLYKQHEK